MCFKDKTYKISLNLKLSSYEKNYFIFGSRIVTLMCNGPKSLKERS